MSAKFLAACLSLAAFSVLAAMDVRSQSTEFSYQGNLNNAGAPANGNYDFEFALFDALSVGSQLGSTLARNGVAVTNGTFSVSLDFGNQFPGADRFLEIRVRPAASGEFTTLAPRQKLASTPYAVKSIVAENALNLGGIPANQYATSAGGSSGFIQNTTTTQPSSNFNISGNGIAAGLLRGDVVSAMTQFTIGSARILGNAGLGNLFAGNGSGIANTGTQNAFFGSQSGFNNDAGSGNTFIGRSAGTNNLSGSSNTFLGFDAGLVNTIGSSNTILGASSGPGAPNLINASAFGSRARVDCSHCLVLGSINGIQGSTADTNVGIGTTSPTSRLHVVGNGLFTGNLTVNGALNVTLPTGSANYIQNQNTAPQASTNFNISGTGKANVIDVADQYFVRGSPVFRIDGTNPYFDSNVFVGKGAGSIPELAIRNSAEEPEGDPAGNFNSFVGHLAGTQVSTGHSNTAMGVNAGSLLTAGIGNSFFGGFAGNSNVSGHNNTVIGYLSDVGSPGLSNSTAIGANAQVSASNSLVLGSITGVNGATSSTNVGIGTTTPTQRLDVVGHGTFSGNLSVGTTSGILSVWTGDADAPSITFNGNPNTGIFRPAANSLGLSTAGVERIRIDSTGNVGIGTTGPVDKLHVNGIIRVATLGAAGTNHICHNASSQIASCSSSARYKSNIAAFSSGLELLEKLRPVSFIWKDGGAADLGLVAEDVAKIEPLLTTANDKGEIEGVKYDRIGVVLINAIKEQQAQIEVQKATIGGQQITIEKQQKEIDVLKALICSSAAFAGSAECKAKP